MLKGSVELVEVERDYFQVRSCNPFLDDKKAIYLSKDFKEWSSHFVFRKMKKRVKWDNLDQCFWFEEIKGNNGI